VAAKKKDVTIQEVAHAVGLGVNFVRDVLREAAGLKVTRDLQDKIFKTARKIGYDFRKLRIGKRMQYRKETLDEVLEKISENPGWTRGEIVKYLKESRALVDRVHRRVFQNLAEIRHRLGRRGLARGHGLHALGHAALVHVTQVSDLYVRHAKVPGDMPLTAPETDDRDDDLAAGRILSANGGQNLKRSRCDGTEQRAALEKLTTGLRGLHRSITVKRCNQQVNLTGWRTCRQRLNPTRPERRKFSPNHSTVRPPRKWDQGEAGSATGYELGLFFWTYLLPIEAIGLDFAFRMTDKTVHRFGVCKRGESARLLKVDFPLLNRVRTHSRHIQAMPEYAIKVTL